VRRDIQIYRGDREISEETSDEAECPLTGGRHPQQASNPWLVINKETLGFVTNPYPYLPKPIPMVTGMGFLG